MILTAYPSSQSHLTERSTRLGQGPPTSRGHLRMDREYYAHSLPDKPKEEWQRLEDHLRNVAEMAKGFADAFGAGEWGYLAGLWHDRVEA